MALQLGQDQVAQLARERGKFIELLIELDRRALETGRDAAVYPGRFGRFEFAARELDLLKR